MRYCYITYIHILHKWRERESMYKRAQEYMLDFCVCTCHSTGIYDIRSRRRNANERVRTPCGIFFAPRFYLFDCGDRSHHACHTNTTHISRTPAACYGYRARTHARTDTNTKHHALLIFVEFKYHSELPQPPSPPPPSTRMHAPASAHTGTTILNICYRDPHKTYTNTSTHIHSI